LLLKKYGGYSVTRNPPNPSQRLGCQCEFFIICIYFDLLLTTLCVELSMPLLVTLSKLCSPIKSIPSLLKVYQQADSQYAFGGAGGICTPVQNTF